MNKEEVKKKPEYRERIILEDNLLISRTTIFLVTNGILLTAVSIANDPIVGILIAILGLVITVFWFICSWQNWKVIKNLTIKNLKANKNAPDPVEEVVQKSLCKHGWRRPTDIIAKPLPAVFLVIWTAIIIVYIFRIVK